MSDGCAAELALQFVGGMPSRVMLAVLVVAWASSSALAQAPGQTAPNDARAVPPLPENIPSPRPTLPPPEGREQLAVVFDNGGFSAVIGEDGSIGFVDHSLGGGAMPLLAWLSFDATDIAMRAAGEDPYLAEKLRIMDGTREERMAVRRRHDRVVMRRALDDLPAYLDAVWQQTAWTPATRRRILFALWDEAAEEGNALLVAGGAEARATIERFIAETIPPGSRHAFSGAELADLNRIRTSRHAFAPYPAPHVEAPLVAAVLRAF
jgi:hypothetical protein